ncbi:MAG: rhodanese-like domain-containing protein [Deltaproteobacteria bacterium]
MARKMQESGFEQVQILNGGWKAWQTKGYPVVPK